MKRHLMIFAVGLACGTILSGSARASWIFRESKYTHDPQTLQRVTQYARARTPMAVSETASRSSGYRHARSAIVGADGSVDRLHRVETYGDGERIRPYGEWDRPFRRGATPYGPWGNPQGPWTTPEDSWHNPYGVGRMPDWYIYPRGPTIPPRP